MWVEQSASLKEGGRSWGQLSPLGVQMVQGLVGTLALTPRGKGAMLEQRGPEKLAAPES